MNRQGKDAPSERGRHTNFAGESNPASPLVKILKSYVQINTKLGKINLKKHSTR